MLKCMEVEPEMLKCIEVKPEMHVCIDIACGVAFCSADRRLGMPTIPFSGNDAEVLIHEVESVTKSGYERGNKQHTQKMYGPTSRTLP